MPKIIFDAPEVPYTVLDTEELLKAAAWCDEKAQEIKNGTITQEDQDLITDLIMEMKKSIESKELRNSPEETKNGSM